MKKYIILLLSLIVINGCKKDEPVAIHGNIAGRISEEGNNNAIEGVTVEILGIEQTIKTGTNGTYKVDHVPADNYSITVSKVGYVSDTKRFTVVPEKTTQGDFSMRLDLPMATPNYLNFSNNIVELSVQLENTRSGEMNYTTEVSKTWIAVTPQTGTIPSLNKRIIKVKVDLTKLGFNTYNENLLINVNGASLSIPIQLIYTEPPFIEIVKPSKDETFKMGETMPIQWNSNLEGKVKIELMRFSSVMHTVSTETPNNKGGSLNWVIPALEKASYQLKITSIENENISNITEAFNLIEGPTTPTVISGNPLEVSSEIIRIEGIIENIGLKNTTVDQYGHVYSVVNPLPTIADDRTLLGSTDKPLTYESSISSIDPGSTYYIKAYATNSKGTSYGNIITVTIPANTPLIETSSIINITQNSAISGGTIINDGGNSITERGICWGTSSPVDIYSNLIVDSKNEIGTFSSELVDLKQGTTYYVKSYAKNSSGVGYGSEKSFTTVGGIATVTTNNAVAISASKATVSGTITDNGGEKTTSYGFCYSETSNPTIGDNKFEVGQELTDDFSDSIPNLKPETKYYVKAYVTNKIGTAYGEELNFTTLDGKANLNTNSATAVSSTKAVISGAILDNGGEIITSYGFCYSKESNPNIGNDKYEIEGSTIGDFEGNISNLIPGTKYYVKAYVINKVGTAYGEELNFITLEGEYVSFTSPYKDEIINVGKIHDITWESNYSDRRIIIEYWYDGNLIELTNNANIIDNSYQWDVPVDTNVGYNNTIKIVDYYTLETLGESSTFNVPGKMTITKPASGYLAQLDNVEIEWIINYNTNLKLELYKGSQYVTDIASNVSSYDGNYTWNAKTAGISASEGYRIKIIDEQKTEFFKVSESFEMVEANSIFTDSRDGQTYKIVTIGNQTWFAQNLNYKTSNSYCNDCINKGRAYPTSDMFKAVPNGWHIPSDEEWKTLEVYLGMTNGEENDTGWRYSRSVGEKLKSTSGWYGGGNGTDEVGFNALPSNYTSSYSYETKGTSWWTSTYYSSSRYSIRALDYWSKGIYRYNSSSGTNYTTPSRSYIRLVKD